MFLWDNTKVTVELRELIESGIKVWDFDYPSFYEGSEKQTFEQKVIDHYYFRQIGQETPARWLHYFRARIREIMPYYKQLYETVKIMEALEDPFGNLDVTETFEQTSSDSSETTSTGSSSSSSTGTSEVTSDTEEGSTIERDDSNTRKFSNTPQGSITNLDNYLTEATVETVASTQNEDKTGTTTTTGSNEASDEAETSATSTGSSTGTVTHTLHRKGNQGVNTYAHDMKEYREILLNIDMMIINELNDLFLMIY